MGRPSIGRGRRRRLFFHLKQLAARATTSLQEACLSGCCRRDIAAQTPLSGGHYKTVKERRSYNSSSRFNPNGRKNSAGETTLAAAAAGETMGGGFVPRHQQSQQQQQHIATRAAGTSSRSTSGRFTRKVLLRDGGKARKCSNNNYSGGGEVCVEDFKDLLMEYSRVYEPEVSSGRKKINSAKKVDSNQRRRGAKCGEGLIGILGSLIL